jgi:hypothetical protein
MIGTPTEPPDLRAIIAKINRELAESAERRKLLAESNKPNRDRWLVPFIAATFTLAAVIGFLAGLLTGFHIGH